MSLPKDIRTTLDVEDIPKKWYNLAADLPKPLEPPINPKTGKPAGPEELGSLFCREILEQEMSVERYIGIPEEVRDNLVYLNRPSPLQRAYRLEKYLKTPAKIYFKREDLSPLGSHKGNTALAQAYYNAEAGIHTLTTETGAGSGERPLLRCPTFSISRQRCSWSAEATTRSRPGSRSSSSTGNDLSVALGAHGIRKEVSERAPGHRRIARSGDYRGLRSGIEGPGTCYSLGSVLKPRMLHQTVIGLEAMEQMKKAEIEPDMMIACAGGGSNFGGFCFP